jgi:hypothetical protein
VSTGIDPPLRWYDRVSSGTLDRLVQALQKAMVTDVTKRSKEEAEDSAKSALLAVYSQCATDAAELGEIVGVLLRSVIGLDRHMSQTPFRRRRRVLVCT